MATKQSSQTPYIALVFLIIIGLVIAIPSLLSLRCKSSYPGVNVVYYGGNCVTYSSVSKDVYPYIIGPLK